MSWYETIRKNVILPVAAAATILGAQTVHAVTKKAKTHPTIHAHVVPTHGNLVNIVADVEASSPNDPVTMIDLVEGDKGTSRYGNTIGKRKRHITHSGAVTFTNINDERRDRVVIDAFGTDGRMGQEVLLRGMPASMPAPVKTPAAAKTPEHKELTFSLNDDKPTPTPDTKAILDKNGNVLKTVEAKGNTANPSNLYIDARLAPKLFLEDTGSKTPSGNLIADFDENGTYLGGTLDANVGLTQGTNRFYLNLNADSKFLGFTDRLNGAEIGSTKGPQILLGAGAGFTLLFHNAEKDVKDPATGKVTKRIIDTKEHEAGITAGYRNFSRDLKIQYDIMDIAKKTNADGAFVKVNYNLFDNAMRVLEVGLSYDQSFGGKTETAVTIPGFGTTNTVQDFKRSDLGFDATLYLDRFSLEMLLNRASEQEGPDTATYVTGGLGVGYAPIQAPDLDNLRLTANIENILAGSDHNSEYKGFSANVGIEYRFPQNTTDLPRKYEQKQAVKPAATPTKTVPKPGKH